MPLPWFHATSAAISAQLGSLGTQGRLPRVRPQLARHHILWPCPFPLCNTRP